jgi:S1-C subfamily serine protease
VGPGARIVFCLAVALWTLTARLAAALELPELAERTKPSVVLITIYDASGRKLGTGSGFFISADGRLVTNVHVIDDARRATATTADGNVVDIAGILAKDADADVAVLQAAGGAYPALPLGESRTLVAGQEIAVIGSPKGLAGTLSTGIVAAIRDRGLTEDDPQGQGPTGDSWHIQITAPISPGSSGSPILTRDGRVVAVAVGQRVGGENLNFGVPIERVLALLKPLGDHPVAQPFAGVTPRSELLRNLSISAAVFAAAGIAYALWRRAARVGTKSGGARS